MKISPIPRFAAQAAVLAGIESGAIASKEDVDAAKWPDN